MNEIDLLTYIRLGIGTVEEDRLLVGDELAAAGGEDRWPIDQTRSLLLVAAKPETGLSDP